MPDHRKDYPKEPGNALKVSPGSQYTGIVVLIGSHNLPLEQRLLIEYTDHEGLTKRIRAPVGAQVGQRYRMTWHRHPGDWQLVPISDKA